MNKEQKIEAIRAKCVEANPEIMEVGSTVSIPKMGTYRAKFSRPIRLSDVLFAIGESKYPYSFTVSSLGTFFANGIRAKGCDWNLRNDDLTAQSDECIDFLYDLLGDKK